MRPAICMCVWQRYDNMASIVEALEKQTYRDFEFWIWNNAGSRVRKEFMKPLKKNTSLDMHIVTSKHNQGSQARFWLVPFTTGNPIIFFDDDQLPRENFVEYMVNEYIKRPNAVQSWKTRIFKYDSYWKRSNKGRYGEEVDYCGTGGMVLPRKLFEKHGELLGIPDPFKRVEDLWLCYVARTKEGMQLIKIHRQLSKLRDNKDQHKLYSLKPVKEECFRKLRDEMGWRLVVDGH